MTDNSPPPTPPDRGWRFWGIILNWGRRQNSFLWLMVIATLIHLFLLWCLSDFSLYHSQIATQPEAPSANYYAEVVVADAIPKPTTVHSAVVSETPAPNPIPRPAHVNPVLAVAAGTAPQEMSARAITTAPQAAPASNALPSSSLPHPNASAMTGVNRSQEVAIFNLSVSSERVVYLIDFSGSMWRKIDTRTRYEVACEQVRKSIRALRPQTQFDVVIFADHAVSFQPHLILADDLGKKQAQDFLNNVPDQAGNTDLVAGLQAAISLQPDCVFLLTDGIANMPEWEVFAKVKEIQKSIQTPARLYAIGLVDFPDSDGGLFLQKLTHINGGTFVPYLSWSQEME